MWRVGCLTMMRRAGLSCHGKYFRVFILSALGELLFSFGSKMAGYAAKEFSRRCLLHVSDNVVVDYCGRRGGGEVAELSLVYTGLGPLVGGGLVGGTPWGGTLPVLTCSQRIAFSSHVVGAGMCGGCGVVGVFCNFLAAPITLRLSMSF